MHALGNAEDHHRGGCDEWCVQTLRQRHAIEPEHHQAPANDTDDETGLDHFPQHDDQSAEHLCYSAITTPLAVSEWNSPMNS